MTNKKRGRQPRSLTYAGVAQLVEQRIRNAQVRSSSLLTSSINHRNSRNHHDCGSCDIYGESTFYRWNIIEHQH